MRYLLIINPVSGVGSKDGLDRLVRDALEGHGVKFKTAFTKCAGHATELARQAVVKGYDGVIVAGGDGTVNEVSAGLVHTNVPLGILPSGSGNGLARHLEIPLDVEEALGVIAKGITVNCDSGELNGRPFFCTCGTGFDARVSTHFAETGGRRGRTSYIRSFLKCFADYKPLRYHIETDDASLDVKALIIAGCNASQYGNNAYIAPSASVRDGMLDITVVLEGNPFQLIRDGIQLFSGLIGNFNSRIITMRTRQMTVTSPHHSLDAHIDGEPIECGDRLEIVCNPRSLRIFSSGETRFQPIVTPIKNAIRDLKHEIPQPRL